MHAAPGRHTKVTSKIDEGGRSAAAARQVKTLSIEILVVNSVT